MTEFTAHMRLPIPNFNVVPWHEEWVTSLRAVDQAIYEALFGHATPWKNSTQYVIGSIVIGPDDGTIWISKEAHVSSAPPMTFAQERAAHPLRWQASVTIPAFRGTWLTNTTYYPNDFVINGAQYAVCVTGHVSGVFANDVASGKWTVLVDVSLADAAYNRVARADLPAAATVNLASVSSSRVRITGAFGGIVSLGGGADEFKIVTIAVNGNTFQHSAALTMQDSVNVVAQANDTFWFISDSVGNHKEVARFRASATTAFNDIKRLASQTVPGVSALATAEEAQAMADTAKSITPMNLADVKATTVDMRTPAVLRFVSPNVMRYSLYTTKVWARAETGTAAAQFFVGVSGTVDNGVGDMTFTFSQSFVDETSYSGQVTLDIGGSVLAVVAAMASGSTALVLRAYTWNLSTHALSDAGANGAVNIMIAGDFL
jgi:hypothetical protein